MDSRMYETLNSITLFQGMNGIDLNLIFDRVQLKIECPEAGDIIARQGELCRQMIILLNGTLEAVTLSPNESYTFKERIVGPLVLEPDILYGIQRNWNSTYTASEECRLMLITKNDVSRLLSSLEIFRINYINAVCTLSAKRRRLAWRSPAPSLRERIVQFVTSHTLQSSGPLEIGIRMRDLGDHLGATRSLVSSVLHLMQNDGVLTLTRGNISIPDIENLH